MIILGVDPGTRYAGYAVIKKEKQRTFLMEAGCVDVHKKKTLVEKIGIIYETLSGKVSEHNVTHLSIETPFLDKNAGTFLKLGYVVGILHLISYNNRLILSEFAPREVKKNITGYGNASKDQVANVVMRLFRIKKPERDDVTDAIAIAMCSLLKS